MGGIYFLNSIENTTKSIQSVEYAFNTTLRLRTDQKVRFSKHNCAGHIVHHGNFKSCGINKIDTDDYLLALYGACWLKNESPDLASPDEVLEYVLANRFTDQCSLKGNYNLFFYDIKAKRLVVETDLFGVYPLYYMAGENGDLYISSEIKALAPNSTKNLCLPAAAEMLKYGYIVTDLTLIEGVRRLMPNSRLIASDGDLQVIDLEFPKFHRDTEATDAILDDLNNAFLKNIARYRNSSNTLSISMSGGLDSRIAAFATKSLDYKIKSWCSGVPGSLECQVAGKVSDQIGSQHFCYEQDGRNLSNWIGDAVWITEGRCHPGHMHFLEGVISGNYRPEMQVHGLIGDIVVGGDLDQNSDFGDCDLMRDRCINSMQSFVYWPEEYLDNLPCEELKLEVKAADQRVAEFIFSRIKFTGNYSDYIWFRYHYRVFGFTIPCLGSQIVPWTDPIFPYLDNEFFEIAAKLNLDTILDRKAQIEWAKKFHSSLSEIPRVKDGVLVDMNRLDATEYDKKIKSLQLKNKIKYYICRMSKGLINIRTNETYPYYDQWYRKWHSLKDIVDATLLSERLSERGLWDAGTIGKLLNDLKSGKNVWNAVGSLLVIESFTRQFMENDYQGVSMLKSSIYEN
jgi:hypothetical protein